VSIEALETIADRKPIDIPVHYGGDDGPDLATVARFAECSEEEVITRHSQRIYRVYMLGFVPGFSYMGRVDPSIAAPRHRVPRLHVPAGSVGIAGGQTGVYPVDSPGGWQLIGRTDTVMFDADRDRPSLLSAGDLVRFVPVTRA
jgi:inhibitor of KinA